MKNIMFLVDGNENWIGGVYYIKNILYSLLKNEKTLENFNIYLYINRSLIDIFKKFKEYPNVHFVEFNKKLSRLEVILQCKEKNITSIYPATNKIISSIGPICIGWIPDFQHIYLKEMFSQKEIEFRNDNFYNLSKNSRKVVLSSNDALQTYKKLYPGFMEKALVLPFISDIEDEADCISSCFISDTLAKYDITSPYIYMPNQFWKHKNHITVFKAINYILKEKKIDIQLVCTGNKNDYRNKDHFKKLCNYINENNLHNNISILGMVSRKEQLAIMKAARLIVQPSLFEGWGTVLEEAKYFNKRVILSDIDVHYEQKNERCIIFKKYDINDLAEKIIKYYSLPFDDDCEKGKEKVEEMSRKYSEISYKLFDENTECKINMQLINNYINKVEQIFKNLQGKRIAIYGTGEHTINLVKAYELLYNKKIQIKKYIDSDIRKKNNIFLEGVIYGPQDIPKMNIDAIVISSHEYQNEIYETIKKYKNIEIIKIYNENEENLFV